MGYLQGKTVYLAGPMLSVADDGIGWRDHIRPMLEDFGLIILDPTRKTTEESCEIADDKAKFKKMAIEGDFYKLREDFSPVARWDLRSVDKSDFIIVSFNFAVPTFGTVDEIVTASMQRKPIIFHYNKSQQNLFNPWTTVRVHPSCLFTDWDDVKKYLDEVDSGNFNKKYWTL